MKDLLAALRQRQYPPVSQAEAARRLGLTRVAVNGWESGERMPAPKHLGALLDIYGATDEERAEAWRLRAAVTSDDEQAAV
jgi:transcriptional regulator with XRE-family HTH domain